jgi:hypothetical protein
MKLQKVICCSKCHEPIVSGESFGFVCFKVPGKEGYQFFHRRSRSGDCWDAYLKEGKSK